MAGDDIPPHAVNGNGTGLSEVEEQFEKWREDMPVIVRDLLRSELPGVIESALARLTEGFIPRQELLDIFEKQRHDADEKYALLSTVQELRVENGKLQGRLNSLEKTVQANTNSIDSLRRFVETGLEKVAQQNAIGLSELRRFVETSVTMIQQTVDSSVKTLTQISQTQSDRQNTAERRIAALEDDEDINAKSIQTLTHEVDDLRSRMLPVRNYIFGGDGHAGMPETFTQQNVKIDAVLALIQPISKKFEALELREQKTQERIQLAKSIGASALKNWKAWAVGIPAGTAVTTVVTAALNNPTSQEILAILVQLFGGN
jgi:hypothetical protein